MFEVIVLLQSKYGANHSPSWCYLMMRRICLYFTALSIIINSGSSNSITLKVALKLQGNSITVSFRDLLLYQCSALRQANCLLLQPNILNSDLLQCWRYSFLSATLPWRLLLARLHQTVDGGSWVPLVSYCSELMTQLDIFWFGREIRLTCFSSRFLGWWLHVWFLFLCPS